MRIIGISGLANARLFKRSRWPGLEEREYGISPGLDAAATLVVNGRVVASAAERRFNEKGEFPGCSIQYCLSQGNLSFQDIDLLVHAYDYSPYEELYLLDKSSAELYQKVLSKQALLNQLHGELSEIPNGRVRQVSHHLAHAAGAYFASKWEDCVVLVLDGFSEGQGVTAYHAREMRLEEIKEIVATNSIGTFLGLVAMHLGFDFGGNEDRIIQLAERGDPARFRPFFEQAVELAHEGTILIPPLWRNKTRREQEFYLGSRRYIVDYLGPPRLPTDELMQRHRDIAAGLEECLRRVLLHICRYLRAATGLPRIALAGDIGVNYRTNIYVQQMDVFDDIFLPTLSGDDGSALGAALLGAGAVKRTVPSLVVSGAR